MYYTVIKHSGHLKTLEKCRKHEPQAFYISLVHVFSNYHRVSSQCNTRLRLLYLLNIFIFNCFIFKSFELVIIRFRVQFRINRPFAGSSHMVRNKLHWDANNAVGLPKQRNSYQSSATFLGFESPTASFASQCNLFRSM